MSGWGGWLDYMQLKANKLELSMAKYDRSHTEKKDQTIDNVFHHYQLSINDYLNNNCFSTGFLVLCSKTDWTL